MNSEIRIRYCESCHKKKMVAELQLERKTIWLCEKCLEKPFHQLRAKRESLEGDRPATP